MSEDDELEGQLSELLGDFPRRSGPGRKPLTPEAPVTYERDLTSEDIEALARGEIKPPAPLPQHSIAKVRYKHQTAARLIAQGLSHVQVAAMSGYSAAHINMNLMRDPTFLELVEHYKRENNEINAEVQARLTTLGMSCAEEIQQRLDDPERASELSVPTLADVMVKALDRSVAPAKKALGGTALEAEGPDGARLVVNLNFAEPPKAPVTIEHEAIDVTQSQHTEAQAE